MTGRTTLERLASAFSSDDLTLREGGCDLDAILAMGFVGASSGMAASALLRLAFDQDLGAVRDAREQVIRLARQQSIKRRWRITKTRELIEIADAALAYYLAPTCPVCRGAKFEPVPGVPMLSDRPCRKCHGTGRRPMPIFRGREIAMLVERIGDIEFVATAAVRKRLRQKS